MGWACISATAVPHGRVEGVEQERDYEHERNQRRSQKAALKIKF